MRAPRIPWRFRRVRERFVGGNSVVLLHDGEQAFPAMLEAIAAARHQVLLEMYWFASDATGRRFAAALADVARRGVEVAVVYDSLGSWDTDSSMFDELEAVGVRLLEYNPLAPWKKRFALGKLTRRDHRKILIVDGRVGFTGGINLGDEWASERDGGKAWRDDLVRVEGPAVEGFLECFHQTWSREGGALLRHFEHAPSEPADGQNVRVLGENRFANRRQIRRAYLLNIYRARETIWITNAYFVPERSVVRALERAATRGVDVRVLLPGESDVEVVRHASRAVWSRLMRRGVRIYEYQKRILHAKSAVIDGIWSTIGTFNLDHLSVRSNLEVNVAVHDQSFGRLMQTRFLTDLDGSLEIDPRVHRFRSLGDRLLERLLYAFRRFM